MTKFVIRRHLSLAHLGDGWETCYIDLSPLSYAEKQAWTGYVGKTPADNALHTLYTIQEHFLDGKAVSDKGIVTMTASELPDLPETVLVDCVDLLKGEGLSANFTTPSNEPSAE